VFQEFGHNLELECSPEREEYRGQVGSQVSGVTKGFPEVWNRGFVGGSRWGQVVNDRIQS